MHSAVMIVAIDARSSQVSRRSLTTFPQGVKSGACPTRGSDTRSQAHPGKGGLVDVVVLVVVATIVVLVVVVLVVVVVILQGASAFPRHVSRRRQQLRYLSSRLSPSIEQGALIALQAKFRDARWQMLRARALPSHASSQRP